MGAPDTKYVNPATINGGFPLPPESEIVREVASRHDLCSSETRIRLPRELGPRAVRRVICVGCDQIYEATRVEDTGEVEASEAIPFTPVLALAPAPDEIDRMLPEGAPAARKPRLRLAISERVPSVRLPSLPKPTLSGADIKLPSVPKLDWRWLSMPVAALVVFVVLSSLQGSEPDPVSAGNEVAASAVGPETSATKEERIGGARRAGGATTPGTAKLINQGTFSLALPKGWGRISPPGGATFAAIAPDGEADVTLWVNRDPKLDFPLFEATSLAQLETLAGSAEVVERNVGPSIDKSSIKIAPAEAPKGAPTYEVVLRGAGKNWYYLATTVMPGAAKSITDAVELIQGSFIPFGGKG